MENKIEIDKNTYIKVNKVGEEIFMSIVVDYEDRIYSISLDLNESNANKLKSIINKD